MRPTAHVTVALSLLLAPVTGGASSGRPATGGGLGRMLARRRIRKPHDGSSARSLIMTSTHEVGAFRPAATDTDVAIPEGYTERKAR
jgi:hypothetical protein